VKRNKLQSETENYYKQLKYLMLFHPSRPRNAVTPAQLRGKMLHFCCLMQDAVLLQREREDVVPVSSCMGMGAKECPSNTTLNVACAEREPRSCHPVFWDYEKR